MSPMWELVLILSCFLTVAGLYGWFLWILHKLVRQLLNEKEKRDERLAHLTDPNVIDAELERSARRREAYDSNMPYPPRDDSGPPARIIIPKRPSINSRFAGRKPRYQPKKDG